MVEPWFNLTLYSLTFGFFKHFQNLTFMKGGIFKDMVDMYFGVAAPIIGAVLLTLGVIALASKKGQIGNGIRSVLGMIPIGGPKLWAVILIIAGLMIGALGGYGMIWQSVKGAQIGSATFADQDIPQTTQKVTCQFSVINGTGAASNAAANVTYTADKSDPSHYYVYLNNGTNMGSASIQGTLLCTRDGNVEVAYSDTCHFKAGTYTNSDSATDSNLYYMVNLASGASLVSGIPAGFKQVAYLNDGAIATTSSNQEEASIVWTGGSSAQKQETIGFLFTLPSSTNVGYAEDKLSIENVIVCDNAGTIATVTVQKISD